MVVSLGTFVFLMVVVFSAFDVAIPNLQARKVLEH